MRWIRAVGFWGFWMFLALTPRPAAASSVYNMLLVGERVESGDVRAIALGGSAQLLSDSLGALASNPALLSRVRLVALGVTQLLAMDEAQSKDYSERDNSFLFPALRFAFPIANRLVFSVGFVSVFDPDGSFAVDTTTVSGEAYTDVYTRSGGLFALPFTLAADITRYASVGVRLSLERGSVEQRWDTIFDDPSFAPGAGFQKADVSGTGFGGGLVLRPIGKLLIGGSYEGAIDFDADVSRQYTQATLDTTFSATGRLPARGTVGVTWGFGRWLFLGSYAWSDFTDFRGLGFPIDRLGSETSLAFGVEYAGIPIGARGLPIRLSFNYQELPYDHPVGNPVDKFLIGIGTGISLQGGRGKIDIAFQGGKTGALNSNGLEDRLIRLYVGLVAGEVWSRRAAR